MLGVVDQVCLRNFVLNPFVVFSTLWCWDHRGFTSETPPGIDIIRITRFQLHPLTRQRLQLANCLPLVNCKPRHQVKGRHTVISALRCHCSSQRSRHGIHQLLSLCRGFPWFALVSGFPETSKPKPAKPTDYPLAHLTWFLYFSWASRASI